MLLLLALPICGQSDSGSASEIALSSANDAYVPWQNSDRFYSYGVGLNLKLKSKKLWGLQRFFSAKTGYFVEVGIRMEGYTPTNKIVTPVEMEQNTISFDRPYAGLLFGTLNATYAFERSFFKTGTLVGIMGPASLSGNFQGWFHDNISDDPIFDAWRYQVPNQLLLNFNATYAYDFIPQQKGFDMYGMFDARLGNLYTDVSPTLGFRIGKFASLTESVGMDNNILSNASGIELFFQASISSTLHLFDGTAQGNLFTRNFEFSVDELPVMSTLATQSIYFSSKRFSLGLEHYSSFGKVIARERHAYIRTIVKYTF